MGSYQLLPRAGGAPRPRQAWRPLLLVIAALYTAHQARQHVTKQQLVQQTNTTSLTESNNTSTSAAPTAAATQIESSVQFHDRLPCNRQTVTVVNGQEWLSPSPALPQEAPLEERLVAWLASPLGSHDNWTRFNNQTCGSSTIRRALNKLHEGNGRRLWEELDERRVRELREEMARMLRKAEREGRFAGVDLSKKGKRGIVFSAGNADTFSRVIVSLRLLRSFGTTLPAEVFHFSSESPSEDQISALKSLNAIARTVEHIDKQASFTRTKSFHIKGAALVQASFDELLYLDSDSLPVRDVEDLFDGKGYKAMGALFWGDYWKDSAENGIWSVLGVQCRDEWTFEAGQFVIDKRRHLDALLLVEHMLASWDFWFKLSDGDKDLFRYAFLALRKRWAVPGRPISSASWTNNGELGDQNRGRFCGHSMVQSDERGEPLFVHANLLKRIAGDFHSGGTWGRTRRLTLPPLPTSSAFTAKQDANFVLTADHLANANSAGVAILPAPPHIRKRAALERGLSSTFWDGHRAVAYVLCVETGWTDPREGEVEEQCGPSSSTVDVGYEGAEMEVTMWEQEPALKWFESTFYEHGGKANGNGFRR